MEISVYSIVCNIFILWQVYTGNSQRVIQSIVNLETYFVSLFSSYILFLYNFWLVVYEPLLYINEPTQREWLKYRLFDKFYAIWSEGLTRSCKLACLTGFLCLLLILCMFFYFKCNIHVKKKLIASGILILIYRLCSLKCCMFYLK